MKPDWEDAYEIQMRKADAAEAEVVRLRGAIAAIQRATVAGKVCDDVAWFDGITTLYDFCDQTLNPPNATTPHSREDGR